MEIPNLHLKFCRIAFTDMERLGVIKMPPALTKSGEKYITILKEWDDIE